MANVLVLATLATKSDEANYLIDRLSALGVAARIVDISLHTEGRNLDGDAKVATMEAAAEQATVDVVEAVAGDAKVIVGIGGEIALRVLRALPITFPKLLVTTLPFDPRVTLADNSIFLVPTLADIAGLNTILRQVLDNTALMVSGLCCDDLGADHRNALHSVGVTALGATDGAVAPLVRALAGRGRESTVFHSNGYGGAAFARFATQGAFDAIVDLTPHELTRIHVDGAHVDMPDRFSAGGALPRVVLPGALNFVGLGEKSLLSDRYLKRPHYAHSRFFTHVKMSAEEMDRVTTLLAESLNALTGPCAVIVPMGGFSHHDRPGGAIEDPALRAVCRDSFQRHLDPQVQLEIVDAHLFDPQVTQHILKTLDAHSA
jgi:uncharacterized protein (UPF0261 family)